MSKAKIKYSGRVQESVTGAGWSYGGLREPLEWEEGPGRGAWPWRQQQKEGPPLDPLPGWARGELCRMAKTQPRRAESVCRPTDSNWGEMKSQAAARMDAEVRENQLIWVLADAWNRDRTYCLIFCVLLQSKSTGPQWFQALEGTQQHTFRL